MQKLFGFLIVFAILISFTTFQQDAFANTYTIKPVANSGSPGCEDKAGCFYPSIISIKVGDTVRFINTDSAAHTFTSGEATNADSTGVVFDSSLVMAGNTYEWSPTKAGDQPYFCIVHPWMTGLIIVNNSGDSSYTPPTPTYTPPTSSGTDWQGKYLKVLSDFNEVSVKVGDLKRENSNLKSQVADLEKTVDDLNAIVMEQLRVIYEWVIGK